MDANRFKQWVEENSRDIINTTQQLLRINSVGTESTAPDRPFGDGCREALDFVLNLGQQHGFHTKDLDGYAGHVELGDSEDYIAVLAHLDVVPEGKGWSYPPYGAEIHDGKIYARGAIDDKGPAMAAFFALKALKELDLPLKKRVRLILGCNEENPIWRCMNYYFDHEPKPIGGFTPDADFPLIYAEKGIMSLQLSFQLNDGQMNQGQGRINMFRAGERENMVPDHAEALLTPPENVTIEEVIQGLQSAAAKHQTTVDLSVEDKQLRVTVHGVSAHGSMPHLGVNAARLLASVLLDVAGFNYPWLSLIATADPAGESLGIACRDEITGALTSNLGVVSGDQTRIDLLFNVRYPVDQTAEHLSQAALRRLEPIGWKQTELHDLRPLYVPKDSIVVKTLQKVYEEEMGTPAELLTIGGGTYARAIPNAVAFGPLFPGQEELAHQKNENWSVQDLLRVTAIYAKAIYELSNAEW